MRWIWRTFADTDWGVTTIARDLNRRGVPTPSGKKWSNETIGGILTNRVYTGANVFGRNRYGKYHHLGTNGETKEGSAGPIQPGEPIVTDAIHDALIDQETFDRVQRKLEQRRQKHNRTRNSPYLFSGLLHCGHCGGVMAGRGYKAKGTYTQRYYTCTTAAGHPGACACYQIPAGTIENYALGLVERRLGGDEVAEQICAAIHRQAKEAASHKSATESLRSRIAAMDKKIQRGTENLLLAAPDDMPDLSRMLGDWRTERAKLQDQLEREATAPAGMTADQRARQAIAELKHLRERIAADDPALVRAAVKELVDEVRLWFEPYGKQKRLAKGYIRFTNEMQVMTGDSHGR